MPGISEIFVSDLLLRLLTCFLLNPEQEFYQSELQRRLDGTLSNTQKMLLKLEKAGLISRFKRGNMTFYRAQRAYPAFEDLKRLIIKTVGIGDLLNTALETLPGRIELAFIFGSYARGDETVNSDIDVFLLGDLSLKEMSKALSSVQEQANREVNPVIYKRKELIRKVQEKNHFVQELLSGPKIWLIGTQNEFEVIAGGR